jgi:nitrogen regulatory protein PII
MVRVTALIRPHRLEAVKTALAALDIAGMTVDDVRGSGNGPESTIMLFGSEVSVALPIRAKVEVAAPEEAVEGLIECILEAAHTGEPGDGKIFLEPLTDALRIRTGQRGLEAL